MKQSCNTNVQSSFVLCNETFDQSSIKPGKYRFDIASQGSSNIIFRIDQPGQYIISVHAHEHAKVSITLMCLFVDNVDIALHLVAKGKAANIDVAGMYALCDSQNVSIKSVQEHAGIATNSDVLFSGLLSGASKIVYDGMIKITHEAAQTHANLQNKNIIMSPQARVVSIPNIEVLQNDVQCFHGSAVGKFNDIAQWYMSSRGLQKSQIKKLLIQGLFAKVLDKCSDKNDIVDIICEKLS